MGRPVSRAVLQGARISTSSPLGRSVTAHFSFARDFRSSVRGRPGTPVVTAGGPQLVAGPRGKYVQANGTGGINTGLLPSQLGMDGAKPRTIIVEYQQGDVNDSRMLLSFGDSSGQQHTQVTLIIAQWYRNAQFATYGDDTAFGLWNGDGTQARVFLAITYDGNVTLQFRSYASVASVSTGVFQNVQFATSTYTLSAPLNTGNTVPLNFLGNGTYGFNAYSNALYEATFFNRCLTSAEIDSFYHNRQQIFEPVAGFPYAALSAQPVVGATLIASAYTPSAAGAALATGIRLSAASTTPSAAGAALSTGIAISAGSSTTSTAGASLSTGNNFSASSTTASAAGAALATSIRLAGSAASPSTAGAALSTSIPISAGAFSPSTAGASLATGSTWSAGSASPSNAGAALQTAIRLAPANASVPSQAGAVLATAVRLAASATTPSDAGAALTTGTPGIDVSQIDPARIVVFEGSGSRVVPFEGSGSRVVVFGGSGARTNLNGVNVKLPTLIGTKWTVDRDPDEISHYGADITQELLDRATTAKSVELVLVGVVQQEAPQIQVVTGDAGSRTYVAAFLGPAAGDPPDGWKWAARVTCANNERFDKTTWFNKVDP